MYPNSTECSLILQEPSLRRWYVFIVVSILVYIFVIMAILLTNFLSSTYRLIQSRKIADFHIDQNSESLIFVGHKNMISWSSQVTEFAIQAVSPQSLCGRCLIVSSFLLNIVTVGIHIARSSEPIEQCLDQSTSGRVYVEILLNIYFTIYFLLRFIASKDKLRFCWVWLNILDYLTLPHLWVTQVTGREWLGLNYLRALTVVTLPEILSLLEFTNNQASLELMRTIANMFSLCMVSAGTIHLIENTGDFWNPILYRNRNSMNFFQAWYLTMVTLSTVGYGDVTCSTYSGRFTIMIVTVCATTILAKAIPAISAFVFTRNKYRNSFVPTPGRKHVIVSGYISLHNLRVFIGNFFHPDRSEIKTSVVVVCEQTPSSEITSLFPRYSSMISYITGSLINYEDCKMACLDTADAVIILCNKCSNQPDEEDYSNIMRAISVKNLTSNVRVIIQIISFHNKVHLVNQTQWNEENGDEIICINEFKLGLMAQSCFAPGFSTLISNLLSVRNQTVIGGGSKELWKKAYIHGASHEIYAGFFSESFVGLSFHQAVEICFEKLRLLLIGVEAFYNESNRYLAINPADKNFKIAKMAKGYFFAEERSDVLRAANFCINCHKNLDQVIETPVCKCRRVMFASPYTRFVQKPAVTTSVEQMPILAFDEVIATIKMGKPVSDELYANGEIPMYDITGSFFCCLKRPFEKATLTGFNISSINLKNHVVLLIYSSEKSTLLDLRNLIIPLRSSCYCPTELKTIVIIGNKEFLMKEWEDISYFPEVYVLPESPMSRKVLRRVKIQDADMVLILTAERKSASIDALVDKDTILMTLNVRSMMFETAVNPQQRGQESPNRQAPTTELKSGFDIPIITELMEETNAMYLDPYDDNVYCREEIFLTESFASGIIFPLTMTDECTCAAYFNSDMVAIMKQLVQSDSSKELETLLWENITPEPVPENPDIAATRCRSRLQLCSLTDGPLADFGTVGCFGDLFLYAVRNLSTICLGLFRLRDLEAVSRYVVTFPAFDFVLNPSDLVFSLVQFDPRGKKKRKPTRKKDDSSESDLNRKTGA